MSQDHYMLCKSAKDIVKRKFLMALRIWDPTDIVFLHCCT